MFATTTIRGPRCVLHLVKSDHAGPPLLLFHGVLRSWNDFLNVCPSLTTTWQVCGLDHRGHGRSERVAGDYRVVDYVEDAVHVVSTSFDQPVVLVGHSLGALVAASVAAELPDHVRAVVLEDPPWTLLGPDIERTSYFSMFAGLRELLREPHSVDHLAALMAQIVIRTPGQPGENRLGDLRDAVSLRYSAKCLTQLDPAVLDVLVAGRWMEGYDHRQILPRVECPALLMQGNVELGGMLPDDEAREAAALLPRSTHVRIVEVGHSIHQMQADSWQRFVLGFLESLD